MFAKSPVFGKEKMYIEKTYEDVTPEKRNNWWIGLVGLACSGFVFIQGGPWPVLDKSYTVYADFMSVSGLREGAQVEVAGVKVGSVKNISLTKDNRARVKMNIYNNIFLPDDSSLAIKSRGLAGEKIINMSRGVSTVVLKPAGVLVETESGADIEDLFTKLFFGSTSLLK